MTIIGIDPGNTHSAFVMIRGGNILEKGYLPNDEFLFSIPPPMNEDNTEGRIVCEMIASYGMSVGRTVFETCVMIGRILQVAPGTQRVTRIQVKSTLCHSAKAKDANVRQALIDIYGPPGTKRNPGGTYGISGDMWAALAVATAAANGCQLYTP